MSGVYGVYGTVGSSVAYGSVGQSREWNKRIWDMLELLQAEMHSSSDSNKAFKAAWNTQLDSSNLREDKVMLHKLHNVFAAMLRKSGMTQVNRVDTKHMLKALGIINKEDKSVDVSWAELQRKLNRWRRPTTPPLLQDDSCMGVDGDMERVGGASNSMVDIDGGLFGGYAYSSFCAGTGTNPNATGGPGGGASGGKGGLQGFFRRRLSLSRTGSESNEWVSAPMATQTNNNTGVYQTLTSVNRGRSESCASSNDLRGVKKMWSILFGGGANGGSPSGDISVGVTDGGRRPEGGGPNKLKRRSSTVGGTSMDSRSTAEAQLEEERQKFLAQFQPTTQNVGPRKKDCIQPKQGTAKRRNGTENNAKRNTRQRKSTSSNSTAGGGRRANSALRNTQQKHTKVKH